MCVCVCVCVTQQGLEQVTLEDVEQFLCATFDPFSSSGLTGLHHLQSTLSI